jgi:hypothetical protein
MGRRSAKPSTIVMTVGGQFAHVLVVTKNTNLMPQSGLLPLSYRFDGAFLPKFVRAPRGDAAGSKNAVSSLTCCSRS